MGTSELYKTRSPRRQESIKSSKSEVIAKCVTKSSDRKKKGRREENEVTSESGEEEEVSHTHDTFIDDRR